VVYIKLLTKNWAYMEFSKKITDYALASFILGGR